MPLTPPYDPISDPYCFMQIDEKTRRYWGISPLGNRVTVPESTFLAETIAEEERFHTERNLPYNELTAADLTREQHEAMAAHLDKTVHTTAYWVRLAREHRRYVRISYGCAA